MSGGFGGGGTSCTICQKVAFPAETISYEKKPYHIECFRCQETVGEGVCGKKLEPSSCSGYEGKIYCKQCFDRGGYTQKQRNVKWTPRLSVSGPTKSRFGGGGTPCEICAKLCTQPKLFHTKRKFIIKIVSNVQLVVRNLLLPMLLLSRIVFTVKNVLQTGDLPKNKEMLNGKRKNHLEVRWLPSLVVVVFHVTYVKNVFTLPKWFRSTRKLITLSALSAKHAAKR